MSAGKSAEGITGKMKKLQFSAGDRNGGSCNVVWAVVFVFVFFFQLSFFLFFSKFLHTCCFFL